MLTQRFQSRGDDNFVAVLRKTRGKLTPGFLALVAAFSITAFLLMYTILSIRNHEEVAREMVTTQRQVEAIVAGLQSIESARLGFLVTHDTAQLASVQETIVSLSGTLRVVKGVVEKYSESDTKTVEELFSQSQMLTTLVDEAYSVSKNSVSAAIKKLSAFDGNLGIVIIRNRANELARSLDRVRAQNITEVVESRDRVEKLFSLMVVMTLGACVFAYILLRKQLTGQAESTWRQNEVERFSRLLRQEHSLEPLAKAALDGLVSILNVRSSALYFRDNDYLRLLSKFSANSESVPSAIPIGEGILGEMAERGEISVLKNALPHGRTLVSALANVVPHEICVVPLLAHGKTVGVLELMRDELWAKHQLQYLSDIQEILGVACTNLWAHEKLSILLEQSKAQADLLQIQQEELRTKNEELEQQGHALLESRHKLEEQHDELQQTNEELRLQTQSLLEQTNEVNLRNQELEKTRQDLESKSEQLQAASKYKSDFLANMSHELRTPLNSLLILSKLLSENSEGNLTSDQLTYVNTISSAGQNLLELINDVLDLAKVEAGSLNVTKEEVLITKVLEDTANLFGPVAEAKGLKFSIVDKVGKSQSLTTDKLRLEQILRNLISNAIKFTQSGEVNFSVELRPQSHELVFSIVDTGIGIPLEKHKTVFEAFQQGDTGTSRQYGGTGLGLTICKELATLLSGRIELQSEVGRGSTFRLIVPSTSIERGETLKLRRALSVEANFVPLRVTKPTTPDALGTILKKAAAALQKPVTKVLVVEDDPTQAMDLVKLLKRHSVETKIAETGGQALDLLISEPFDCMVLDLGLQDMSGIEVLNRLSVCPQAGSPVVIVYTAKDLTRDEELALRRYSEKIIIKGEKSQERLANEVDLFVHSKAVLPLEKRGGAERIGRSFQGKHVLVVDDDIRNVFSIARALESRKFKVTVARDGFEAIQTLSVNKEIDLVLMDIMMPRMDGIETITKIRTELCLAQIPIIALSAKVMKEDQDKCYEAGANAFVPKPIQIEKLFLTLESFLHE